MRISRRAFGAGALAGLAFAGLGQRSALAASGPTYRSEVKGYGPLVPDPAGYFDLPADFSYRILSSAGGTMDDGFVIPDKFDGMGCFGLPTGELALVRNHELGAGDFDLGPTAGRPRLESALRSKPHFDAAADGRVLPGGNTTLVLDPRSLRVKREFLSLAGTAVNCAGGTTPWGSWLSCEETVIAPDEVGKAHGWVFEIPAAQPGLVEPVALTALGRFRHEAAAVDHEKGIVYLTEDRPDGLFYRLIPNRPGNLRQGGRLQALALRDLPGADTRNWDSQTIEPGEAHAVRWIDLEDIGSPKDDLRHRGRAAGAAIFARGEGVHGKGEYYFTCTSGGPGRFGQIMRYRPSPSEGEAGEEAEPGTIDLFVESQDPLVLDYADNVVVAPNGHLIVCEDRTDGKINHLKGVTPQGKLYTLARLNADTELAGACFSPDGRILFVNAYRPGRTLAITGPWARFEGRLVD